MRRILSSALVSALALVFALSVAACGGATPGDGSPTTGSAMTTGPVVRVGSFLDSMIIQLLEQNGIKTEDKTKLGTPEVLRAVQAS